MSRSICASHLAKQVHDRGSGRALGREHEVELAEMRVAQVVVDIEHVRAIELAARNSPARA